MLSFAYDVERIRQKLGIATICAAFTPEVVAALKVVDGAEFAPFVASLRHKHTLQLLLDIVEFIDQRTDGRTKVLLPVTTDIAKLKAAVPTTLLL